MEYYYQVGHITSMCKHHAFGRSPVLPSPSLTLRCLQVGGGDHRESLELTFEPKRGHNFGPQEVLELKTPTQHFQFKNIGRSKIDSKNTFLIKSYIINIKKIPHMGDKASSDRCEEQHQYQKILVVRQNWPKKFFSPVISKSFQI